MGIYGQDWASYQSAAPSTSGLGFVFIKVTEGLGYTNPLWQQQRDHARAAGLVVGYYHYPHMANSPQTEADHFLSVAQPAAGELLCLDWEGYDAANSGVSHANQLAYKEAFLRHLKAAAPHQPVGMYCNTDYWNNVDTTGYVQDFLWIATAGRPAGQPGISANWLFHQYNDSPVDSDYCHLGSTAELHSWATSFAQPTVQEDDMPFSEDDIRRFVREEASGQVVRDANAFAVFWWLQQAIAGTVPPGASGGWAELLQAAHGAITPDATAAAVWNHMLPDWGLDGSGKAVALGTSKAAYWHQVWNDVYAGQQQALIQQVLAAAQAAKLTPAELQQALADGTLKVQVTVAPASGG